MSKNVNKKKTFCADLSGDLLKTSFSLPNSKLKMLDTINNKKMAFLMVVSINRYQVNPSTQDNRTFNSVLVDRRSSIYTCCIHLSSRTIALCLFDFLVVHT